VELFNERRKFANTHKNRLLVAKADLPYCDETLTVEALVEVYKNNNDEFLKACEDHPEIRSELQSE